MSKWAVSGSTSASNEFFPIRPAFGAKGREVILWANYFALTVDPKPLYKYSLTVSRLAAKKSGGESKTGGEGGGAPAQHEAKGRKLRLIVEQALNSLPKKGRVATEYKQQVITVGKLELPPNGTVKVVLPDDQRQDAWTVNFNTVNSNNNSPAGPESVQITDLLAYIQTMRDSSNETVFPKYQGEIDALNVIFGHAPRTDPHVSAVGSSRFFAFDATRKEAASTQPPIEILRGYYQSVRPATGRLLLNTNVTAGVFRYSGPLKDIFDRIRVPRMGNSELTRLHKLLSKARIEVGFPGAKPGEGITWSVRTAAGLCAVRDGTGGKTQGRRAPLIKPTNNWQYGTPTTTSFFLTASPQSPEDQAPPPPRGLKYDTYVTVEKYFIASK